MRLDLNVARAGKAVGSKPEARCRGALAGGARPANPWYAKAVAAFVAAYALSPIDLIPDFIPVLGYLDDLLIIPLGIALAIHLIPADLMAEFRAEANQRTTHPQSLIAASIIITVWLLAIGAAALWTWRYFR